MIPPPCRPPSSSFLSTHRGNASEFCVYISPALECTTRVKSLIVIGAVSSGLCILALIARAAGLSDVIELLISFVLLGLWVASSAILTSYRTTGYVGGPDALLWGSPAFFASWGGALVSLSLFLRAVCNSSLVESLGLKDRRPAGARGGVDAEEPPKSLDVSTSDGGEAAAEYA